jgi:TolB-like protein/tetratricopeptide (TPR) repeat protein
VAERDGERQATDVSTDKPDVFISYASQDAAVADAVVSGLEHRGLKCWIAPRDVTPGEFYADAIVRALNDAPILVLVLTENAVASPHVLREVERTSAKRHAIISLRLTSVSLPPALEYFLSASHWLDASTSGIDHAMQTLAEAITHIMMARPTGDQSSRTGDAGTPAAGQFPQPFATKQRLRPSRPAIALIGMVAVILAYFAVNKLRFANHTANERPVATVTATAAPPAADISEKSVAVLPFVDMSEKKDQDYLADGMAEEIIDLLVKVPDLHVPARTSSFYFKGKSEDIPTIAHRLLVTYVLEGSVRKIGDHLRITAQLVRADNGYHLWSETYDRDMHDVFKVQDDIANAVVQALQITLMGGPLTRRQGGTQNLEAYQLYLRSRTGALQNTKTSLEAERKYLEQAVNLDPSFGLAWARMATNSLTETENGMLPPAEGFERARQLAQRALQLSPDLGEPHACLGYVYRSFDWDWASAESELRRALALDLNSSSSIVQSYAGIFYNTVGHWVDAERHLRAALARDPLSTYAMFNLGSNLYGAGRYADSEAMYRRLLEAAPGFLWTRPYLAKALLMEGKPEAAVAMVQQEDDEEYRLIILPVALQAAGHQSAADEALKVLLTKYADRDAYFVAMTYAYRGDHDLALQWLERAYTQKDTSLVEIVGEPLFKNLATDPRFKAFLRKMNLPE